MEKALKLYIEKEHLTKKGLHKIIAIRASINRGLSPELQKVFYNVDPVDQPLVQNKKKIEDPNWLSGFTSAEGCFFCHSHRISNSFNRL